MNTKEILQGILKEPSETLEVEIKNWLDLNDNEVKAKVAKELIALANHGGGYLIFGFDDQGANFQPLTKPEGLTYDSDTINGIVSRYCDPQFHCDVLQIAHPELGTQYPVVVVSGNQTVPIHATRSGPNEQHIKQNTCYIRRAGAKSEPPQNSGEWQELMQRCVLNNQDQLLDAIRGVVSGEVTIENPIDTELQLDEWVKNSGSSLETSYSDLRDNFTNGYYRCGFIISDIQDGNSFDDLENILKQSINSSFMWQPFKVYKEFGSTVNIKDGCLEGCAKHPINDSIIPQLWRVAPNGYGYSVTKLPEDLEHNKQDRLYIDPLWQTTYVIDYLLFINNFASCQDAINSSVTISFNWTGLNGRYLDQQDGSNIIFPSTINRVCQSDSIQVKQTYPISNLERNLPEVVESILEEFFQHFNLYSVSSTLYREIVSLYRS